MHVRLIAEAAVTSTESELRELLAATPALLRGSLDLRLALAGQLPVLAAGIVRAAPAPDAPGASPAAAVSGALLAALDAVGDAALALVLDDSEGVRRAGVDCVVATAWEMVTAAAARLEGAGEAPAPASLAAPLVARACPAAYARLLGALGHMLASVASHPSDRYSSSSPRLAAGLLPLCVGVAAPTASGAAAGAAGGGSGLDLPAEGAGPPPLAPRAAFDTLIAHLVKQSSSESELVRLACADALPGWAAALSAEAALPLAGVAGGSAAPGKPATHVASLVACTLALLSDADNSVRESATRAFSAVCASASQLQLLLSLVPAYHALLRDSSDRVSIAAGTHLGALISFVVPAADARLLSTGGHRTRGGEGGSDSTLHRLMHVWLLLASGKLKGERSVEHRGAPPPPRAVPLRSVPPMVGSPEPPPSAEIAVATLQANRGDGLFASAPPAGARSRSRSPAAAAASRPTPLAADAPPSEALVDTVLEAVASPLSLVRSGSRLSLVPSPAGGGGTPTLPPHGPPRQSLQRQLSAGGFGSATAAAVAAALDDLSIESARSRAAAASAEAAAEDNSDDGYSSSGSGAEVLSAESDDGREAADDEDEEGDGWGGGFTASGALSDVRVCLWRVVPRCLFGSTCPAPPRSAAESSWLRGRSPPSPTRPCAWPTALTRRPRSCRGPSGPRAARARRSGRSMRRPSAPRRARGTILSCASASRSRCGGAEISLASPPSPALSPLQGLMRCIGHKDTNGRATATLLAAYPSLLAGLGAAYVSLDAASSAWAARGGDSSSGSSVSGGSSPGPSVHSYTVPGDVGASAVLSAVLDHLIACLKQHGAAGTAHDTRHAAITAAAAVIGCFPFRQQMRLLRAVLAAAGIHARPHEPPPLSLPPPGRQGDGAAGAAPPWGGLRLLRSGTASGRGSPATGSPLRSGGRNSAGGFSTSPVKMAASGPVTPLTITATAVTDALTLQSPAPTPLFSPGGTPAATPSVSDAPLVHVSEGLFELTDAREATWRERVLLCRRCVRACVEAAVRGRPAGAHPRPPRCSLPCVAVAVPTAVVTHVLLPVVHLMVSADAVAAVRLAATSAMPAIIGAAAAPPEQPEDGDDDTAAERALASARVRERLGLAPQRSTSAFATTTSTADAGAATAPASEAPRMLQLLCAAAEQVPGRHQDRVAFIQVRSHDVRSRGVGRVRSTLATSASRPQLCGLLFEAAEAELARNGGSPAASSSASATAAPAAAPPPLLAPEWGRYDSCVVAARHLLSLDGFAPPPPGGLGVHHPWAAAATAFAPSVAAAAALPAASPAPSHTLSAVLAAVPVWRTSPLSASQAFLDAAPVSVAGALECGREHWREPYSHTFAAPACSVPPAPRLRGHRADLLVVERRQHGRDGGRGGRHARLVEGEAGGRCGRAGRASGAPARGHARRVGGCDAREPRARGGDVAGALGDGILEGLSPRFTLFAPAGRPRRAAPAPAGGGCRGAAAAPAAAPRAREQQRARLPFPLSDAARRAADARDAVARRTRPAAPREQQRRREQRRRRGALAALVAVGPSRLLPPHAACRCGGGGAVLVRDAVAAHGRPRRVRPAARCGGGCGVCRAEGRCAAAAAPRLLPSETRPAAGAHRRSGVRGAPHAPRAPQRRR